MKRCNRPAAYIMSRNGYRECEECFNLRGDIDGPAQGWIDLSEQGPSSSYGRCDKPVPGCDDCRDIYTVRA